MRSLEVSLRQVFGPAGTSMSLSLSTACCLKPRATTAAALLLCSISLVSVNLSQLLVENRGVSMDAGKVFVLVLIVVVVGVLTYLELYARKSRNEPKQE